MDVLVPFLVFAFFVGLLWLGSAGAGEMTER
jgi:hypothetical protein